MMTRLSKLVENIQTCISTCKQKSPNPVKIQNKIFLEKRNVHNLIIQNTFQ